MPIALGFQLDHNAFFNEQVHSKPRLKVHLLVNDWKRHLPSKTYLRFGKLVTKASLIDRLQQPGSKIDMNPISSIHHLLSNAIHFLRYRLKMLWHEKS